MRLRKNLRVLATLLATCLCLFLIVNIGEKCASKISKTPTKSSTSAVTFQPETSKDEKAQAAESTTKQNKITTNISIQGYSSDVNQIAFENTVIIGSSFAVQLANYELVKTADFYCNNNLTIKNIGDYVDTATSLPFYDAISQTSHRNIVFIFGQNEIDWSADRVQKSFMEMIAHVAESQQNARLFICAVSPVSKIVSDIQLNGLSMDKINAVNASLQNVAQSWGAEFVNPIELFADNEGYLIDEASADGINLEYKYCKAWVNYLSRKMGYYK